MDGSTGNTAQDANFATHCTGEDSSCPPCQLPEAGLPCTLRFPEVCRLPLAWPSQPERYRNGDGGGKAVLENQVLQSHGMC
jgi:hypothetical protein